MIGQCNCGKEGKYVKTEEDGTITSLCHKRADCKPYDELVGEINKLRADLHRSITAAKDLTLYRWDTSLYNDAENKMDELFKKYEKILHLV